MRIHTLYSTDTSHVEAANVAYQGGAARVHRSCYPKHAQSALYARRTALLETDDRCRCSVWNRKAAVVAVPDGMQTLSCSAELIRAWNA